MSDKKIKFLGMTIYKRKTKGNKTITRFLNIPVWKKIHGNKKNKYYLFGAKVYKKDTTIKNCNNTVYTKIQYVEQRKYILVSETSPKELLIVNTDSIGDYILFRNFLKTVKNSKKYKDYKIVLLGCEKYKDFAEYLDSDTVDKFLWVPQRPQNLSPSELERIRCNLHNVQGMKHYYDTIIFPSFNSMPKRNAHNHLISSIIFKENIIYCDEPNPSRNCNDMLPFTHVYVNYKAHNMFEFDLNKAFYENLLDENINLSNPFIEEKKIDLDFDFFRKKNKEYIVINPCAYDKYRMWHKNNWIKVMKYLQEKGYDIILICGKNEQGYCEELAEDSHLKNIEIKAGLPVKELLAILKLAKLYIGQDSGVFHIAAALNIRALCLSAGNAYFRFMNYPKNRKNIKIVFPEGTEKWINDNNQEFPALVRNVNCFFINSIKPLNVIKNIEELLDVKDIFFICKFKTENTGDLEICPYDYFPEYFNQFIVQKVDNDYLKFLHFKKSIFILGGGGLINQNDDWNNGINKLIENKNTVIGWGIGFNQHKGETLKSEIKLNDFTLLGIRDYNIGYPYLPCVSCLKKELMSKSKIKRKIGCIIHYENTDVTFGCPTMYNNQPFEDIINFISESEIIITNTYHIMYWSTLMNKKVIIFNPFSNKFDNFKFKPVKYTGYLEADIKKAKNYPEAMEECKKLNLAFFEKVKKSI